MKGGHQPIHIQRWAPADYVNDPFVKLLVSRRDFQTLSFYNLVINWSFIEGGDLPSDEEALAAILGMSVRDVKKSLPVCLEAGKLFVEDTCLFNERVRAEVSRELAYRAEQTALGTRGGKAAGKGRPLRKDRGTPMETDRGWLGPPSPAPTPVPVTDLPAPPATVVVSRSWNQHACELWIKFQGPVNSAHGARITNALRPLVKAHDWPLVETLWTEALEEAAGWGPGSFTPEVFARSFTARLKQRQGVTRAPPGKSTVGEKSLAAAERFIRRGGEIDRPESIREGPHQIGDGLPSTAGRRDP